MKKHEQQEPVNERSYPRYKSYMQSQRKHKLCHKRYPAYQSVVTKKKSTVYESKFGGIPYIPKGEKWIVCDKCQVEKVLILQLNIQELPEVSDKLKEWDFIQIFACMKPSETLLSEQYSEFKFPKIYEESIYNNYEQTKFSEIFYKIKEENRCYNILERDSDYDPFYHELIDGKNMFAGEPFNSYFDIKLVKKDKPPQKFSSPPWINGYNLYYDEEQKKVISSFYNNKRTYRWVEAHLDSQHVITSWKKVKDVECMYHGDSLNMCFTNYLGAFKEFDFLGLLSEDVIDKVEGLSIHYDDKHILDCPLCKKTLTLLFQFKASKGKYEYDKSFVSFNDKDVHCTSQLYALFYCENHPESMTCFGVFYDT